MLHAQPKTISGNEYHDFQISDLRFGLSEVSLGLSHSELQSVTVILKGVRHFLALDVLIGNIVDIIECHSLAEVGAMEYAASLFASANSDMFPDRVVQAMIVDVSLRNCKFVAVQPIWGASIYAIVEFIEEVELV